MRKATHTRPSNQLGRRRPTFFAHRPDQRRPIATAVVTTMIKPLCGCQRRCWSRTTLTTINHSRPIRIRRCAYKHNAAQLGCTLPYPTGLSCARRFLASSQMAVRAMPIYTWTLLRIPLWNVLEPSSGEHEHCGKFRPITDSSHAKRSYRAWGKSRTI